MVKQQENNRSLICVFYHKTPKNYGLKVTPSREAAPLRPIKYDICTNASTVYDSFESSTASLIFSAVSSTFSAAFSTVSAASDTASFPASFTSSATSDAAEEKDSSSSKMSSSTKSSVCSFTLLTALSTDFSTTSFSREATLTAEAAVSLILS